MSERPWHHGMDQGELIALVEKLQQMVKNLTERVVGQSELLSRKAEKTEEPKQENPR